MVWHDGTAVGEGFATDSTFHVLLDDLTRQQFPHFRQRSQFAVPSRVVRVFNSLNRHPAFPFFCSSLRPQQKIAL
jgi:hypothetical protein